MNTRLLALSALVTFVLALATGCSQSSGKIKIGFVTNNDATFWNYAEAGCKAAAKDLDVDVLFRRPPVNTAAAQKQIIDDMLLQGIQGIAISVIDPKNQTEYLNSIAEKIPLITQDNDAPESKRLCYLGTDNYEAGKAVGKLVREAMPQGGIIAIFVGQTEPLNARQRRQGVLDELAGKKDATGEWYGKYRLYGSGGWGGGPFTDETDVGVAKDNADKVLTKFSNEKNLCLIGLWGYNPPAILSAVEAKGRLGKVKIVGFDEYDETLIGIQKGHIHGTVVQQPYKFGYESVKLLVDVVKGDKSGIPENGIRYIPHRVITRENVDAFRKELEKLRGK